MARKKSRAGRPKEGREPFLSHVLPHVREHIDGMVDRNDSKRNSRGKIIEEKFGVWIIHIPSTTTKKNRKSKLSVN